MKQIVRLTENDIHRIVKQVITEALDEMDKNMAIKPMTIYTVANKMTSNGQYSSKNRIGDTIRTNPVNIKARKMMDRTIMHYVIQHQKPHLSFTMKDKTHPNGNVGIEFDIKEIKEFSDNQMQLYGFMISANWKGYIKKHGIIKCVFGQEGKNGSPYDFRYYLVENYGSTVKTPSIELLGESDNAILS